MLNKKRSYYYGMIAVILIISILSITPNQANAKDNDYSPSAPVFINYGPINSGEVVYQSALPGGDTIIVTYDKINAPKSIFLFYIDSMGTISSDGMNFSGALSQIVISGCNHQVAITVTSFEKIYFSRMIIEGNIPCNNYSFTYLPDVMR